MKTAKKFRTLEELWDLEDKYPLVESNPAGLLRWMFATRMLPSPNGDRPPRPTNSRRSAKRRRKLATQPGTLAKELKNPRDDH